MIQMIESSNHQIIKQSNNNEQHNKNIRSDQMSKMNHNNSNNIVDKYPYKEILYLNWYEAAIAHLLLFKFYVEKYSHNVYFLISEQGILLKAVTKDYLAKVSDQITKFFTAKIEELDLCGSPEFYNNVIDEIKEKLKETRDCPYINLVYSEKLRNSCLAMKNLGYVKPYENWEYHQREKKGFCFLIVRPEHRWKEIATNIYNLAKKRQSSYSKSSSDLSWPVEICYEKFIWFYLKESFKKFKKSIEIKDNKSDKCLTIIIKKEIPELADLEKQIASLMFFYKPTISPFRSVDKGSNSNSNSNSNNNNKKIVLSPLEVEKITELIYHEFGLTNFAKELRKKMTGYLVITSHSEFRDSDEDGDDEDGEGEGEGKGKFSLWDKEEISPIFPNVTHCTNGKMLSTIVKMSKRHSIVSYQRSNYMQLRIDKPIKENYEKILKVRLPCLPRYYYWYQNEHQYFMLRMFYPVTFASAFHKHKIFHQMFLLYNLICIVDDLHQRGIVIGKEALEEACFVDEKRVIVEPEQIGSKEADVLKLKELLVRYMKGLRDEEVRAEIESMYNEASQDPFGLIEYLEDFIDSNS